MQHAPSSPNIVTAHRVMHFETNQFGIRCTEIRRSCKTVSLNVYSIYAYFLFFELYKFINDVAGMTYFGLRHALHTFCGILALTRVAGSAHCQNARGAEFWSRQEDAVRPLQICTCLNNFE